MRGKRCRRRARRQRQLHHQRAAACGQCRTGSHGAPQRDAVRSYRVHHGRCRASDSPPDRACARCTASRPGSPAAHVRTPPDCPTVDGAESLTLPHAGRMSLPLLMDGSGHPRSGHAVVTHSCNTSPTSRKPGCSLRRGSCRHRRGATVPSRGGCGRAVTMLSPRLRCIWTAAAGRRCRGRQRGGCASVCPENRRPGDGPSTCEVVTVTRRATSDCLAKQPPRGPRAG